MDIISHTLHWWFNFGVLALSRFRYYTMGYRISAKYFNASGCIKEGTSRRIITTFIYVKQICNATPWIEYFNEGGGQVGVMSVSRYAIFKLLCSLIVETSFRSCREVVYIKELILFLFFKSNLSGNLFVWKNNI